MRDNKSPPQGSGTTMTSIAADLEEAMLYTCLANDKGEVELITDSSSSSSNNNNNNKTMTPSKSKPKTHIALSPNGSFGSLDDSTTSYDDSESDVSLCRASSYPNRRHQPAQPTVPVYSDAIEIEPTNGYCTTSLWPSNLFRHHHHSLCSVHHQQNLEGAESVTSGRETISSTSTASKPITPRQTLTRHVNTSIASQPIMKKKPALKRISNTTTSNKTNKSRRTNNNKKKRVNFAQVKVREYTVSLSQNPSCSEGPPIELGWDYREPPPLSLDTFEKSRQSQRRRLPDLLLSDSARRKMLLQNYYTPQQITSAIREVEQLKRQRVITYLMLPAAALDEAAEEMYEYWTSVFR